MYLYLLATEALIQYAYKFQMLCTFALGTRCCCRSTNGPIGVGVEKTRGLQHSHAGFFRRVFEAFC